MTFGRSQPSEAQAPAIPRQSNKTYTARQKMRFPLDLRFKIISLASRISVRDADDRLLFHVKQKLLKLKEAVTVFEDEEQTRPRYQIAADRVLDISARYHISDMDGRELGALQRRGMRSIWRAHYEIYQNGEQLFEIREENPWIKLADGFFGELPIIGLLSGYVFHPVYVVTRVSSGEMVMRLVKQPALLETSYRLEANPERLGKHTELTVMSVLMALLLERQRG